MNFLDSAGEESGDDQASRGQSRADSLGGLAKFEGHGRMIVDNEGNLDPSALRRVQGYMFKKGGAVNARGGFRNWKKRWFVLSPMEFLGHVGYELQYFDAPNGTLKGTVSLSDVEILCESKSHHKIVKHEFQIKLQTGGILQLSCDSESERDEWLDSLNIVVSYLHKITTDSAMTLDGYDPAFEDDEVVYKLGEEIAQNCHALGPGLFGAEAGQTAAFVVQIHDLLGQKVTRGNMPITATISNADCLYHLIVVDNDDGTYAIQYTLGHAGSYQLAVKLNDEHHIFGSPFDIAILPARTLAKYCEAEGDVLHSIVASPTATSHSFVIQARDGFGNPKQRGGDPFEVGLMGPATLTALQDNADGTYTCTLQLNFPPPTARSATRASLANSYAVMILVTLHGKHIAGSPFKPVILEGRSAPSLPLSSSAAASMTSAQAGSAGGLPESLRAFAPASSSQSPPPMPMPQPPLATRRPSSASNASAASVPATSTATAIATAAMLSPQSPQPQSPQPQPQSSQQQGPSFATGLAFSQSAASSAPYVARSPLPSAGSADALNVGGSAAEGDVHPMSRLERSRQRALLAKQISEGSVASPPPPPNDAAAVGSQANQRMVISKTLTLSALGASSGGQGGSRSAAGGVASPLGGAIGSPAGVHLGSAQFATPGAATMSPLKGATKLSVLAQRSAQTLQAKRQQSNL